MNNKLHDALSLLDVLVKEYPEDVGTKNLYQKVKEAQQAGAQIADDGSVPDFDAGHLSLLARWLLKNSEYIGLDDQDSIEQEMFSASHVEDLKVSINSWRKKSKTKDKNRYRAPRYLTLAKIYEQQPELASESESLEESLIDYFGVMVELAVEEQYDIDVLRTYILETLVLLDPESSELNRYFALLMETYTHPKRIKTSSGVKQQLSKFSEEPDLWKVFSQDSIYYQARAPDAWLWLKDQLLERNLKIRASVENFQQIDIKHKKIFQRLLQLKNISLAKLSEVIQDLTDISDSVLFRADQDRLNGLIKNIRQVGVYEEKNTYKDKARAHSAVELAISSSKETYEMYPTEFSLKYLIPSLDHLLELVQGDFSNRRRAEPTIELANILENDHYNLN